MFSVSVHDFKICGCPNGTFIDGGFHYLRFGWGEGYPRPKTIAWNTKIDGELKSHKEIPSWPY